MPTKRSLLGFEDSDDDTLEAPALPIIKRQRVPKPIFKPTPQPKSSTSSPTDSPHPEEDTTPKPTLGGPATDDYLTMTIQEDEATGPQRLSSHSNSPEKPTPQDHQVSTFTRMKTPLFGQIDDSSTHVTSNVMKSIPNEPLRTSKGLKIMQKMGFKVGDTLGADSQSSTALKEPIIVVPRSKTIGIKVSENKEQEYKEGVSMADEAEFKKRQQDETKRGKLERVLRKMQKYCFEFEDRDVVDVEKVDLRDLNVMWRGYVRDVQEAIRRKREEKKLEGGDDHVSEIGTSDGAKEQDSEEIEENVDEELELFEEQPIEKKIERLNLHLRSEYDYCFYCGTRYDGQDDLFQNCPGSTEEEHL